MSAARFRLTRPEQSETEVHEAIAQALTILVIPGCGCEWTAMPAFGYCGLTPAQTAKLSRMGVHAGWPDFLLAFDRRCLGLEIKRRGTGRLSRTRIVRTKRGRLREVIGQDTMFPRLALCGMEIQVVRSVDEAIAQCIAWNLPLRGSNLSSAQGAAA